MWLITRRHHGPISISAITSARCKCYTPYPNTFIVTLHYKGLKAIDICSSRRHYGRGVAVVRVCDTDQGEGRKPVACTLSYVTVMR